MSAQHPPGVDGQAQLFPPPVAPDYSRRFVLSLAGSATSLGISTIAHTTVAPSPPVAESGEHSPLATLIWMVGSGGWLALTVGLIAVRELRYGYNRLFPRMVVNQHFHYHLPEPPPETGNRKRGSKRANR